MTAPAPAPPLPEDCEWCGHPPVEHMCVYCGAYLCESCIERGLCQLCRPWTPEEVEEIERRNVSPLSPDEEAAMAELLDRHLAPAFRAAGVSA